MALCCWLRIDDPITSCKFHNAFKISYLCFIKKILCLSMLYSFHAILSSSSYYLFLFVYFLCFKGFYINLIYSLVYCNVIPVIEYFAHCLSSSIRRSIYTTSFYDVISINQLALRLLLEKDYILNKVVIHNSQ